MSESREFGFGDQSVAGDYDEVLVPILFEPWGIRLMEDHGPWKDRRVLDLATGTGAVAKLLSERIGPGGELVGTDINREMLAFARRKCADLRATVRFVESPADSLEVESGSVDVVVCQQGFQFFPEKGAAAREILRVLRRGGRTVVSTWHPVESCQFFGAVCRALESVGEAEISAIMRIPFDHMPASELLSCFRDAGFADVRIRRRTMPLVIAGGVAHAVRVAYSTPIGPRLRALPEERQVRFQEALARRLGSLSVDGETMGRMVSNELTAKRSDRHTHRRLTA